MTSPFRVETASSADGPWSLVDQPHDKVKYAYVAAFERWSAKPANRPWVRIMSAEPNKPVWHVYTGGRYWYSKPTDEWMLGEKPEVVVEKQPVEVLTVTGP